MTITRLLPSRLLLIILCFEQLWTTPPFLRAQQKEQQVRERSQWFRGIVEPPELTGDAYAAMGEKKSANIEYDRGTPVGVQQKLMRHTDVRTTMRYGDAFTSDMAEAHGKVVGLALNGMGTACKPS